MDTQRFSRQTVKSNSFPATNFNEVALGRDGSKASWFTFSPIPTMEYFIRDFSRIFSISIPAILRLFTYMSLGHLIFTAGEYSGGKDEETNSARPSARAFVSQNWSFIGKKWGRNTMLKVRLTPGGLSQELPLCPLPAYCYRPQTTYPSSRGAFTSRS